MAQPVNGIRARRGWAGRRHGTVTVCTGVTALEPQALAADTVNAYDPGPALPLNVSAVVEKLPANAPVTLT
jgi:hypothetical protein